MEEGQGAQHDQHGTPSRKIPSPPSPPSVLGKNVSSQKHKTIINGLEVGGASASAYSRVHIDVGETAQRKLAHKRIDRVRKGSVTHRNVSKQQLKGIRGSQKRNCSTPREPNRGPRMGFGKGRRWCGVCTYRGMVWSSRKVIRVIISCDEQSRSCRQRDPELRGAGVRVRRGSSRDVMYRVENQRGFRVRDVEIWGRPAWLEVRVMTVWVRCGW